MIVRNRQMKPRGVFTDERDGKLYAFVKSSDIPRLLNSDAADVGFLGSDKLDEAALGGRWLNMARTVIADAGCSMVAASKSPEPIIEAQERIATSYPNITLNWLRQTFGETPSRGRISFVPTGSVEAYVRLGVAEAIVDIRESGRTLQDNGLPFYEIIRPVVTEMIARDMSRPPEPELNVSGLYAAIGRIEQRLLAVVGQEPREAATSNSITQLLFMDRNELVKKFGSETGEWLQALVQEDGEGLVNETQDVLYVATVGLMSQGRSLIEALNKL